MAAETLQEELRQRGLARCLRCGRWLLLKHIRQTTWMCRDSSDCLKAVTRLEPEVANAG